jgi:hypothetical protein
MSCPGWNDLECVKKVSSIIADVTVGFWVAMALLEGTAYFGKYSKRISTLLAKLGLLAFLVAVTGEAIQRMYEHRKDALYDAREAQITQNQNKIIEDAKSMANKAQAGNATATAKATNAQVAAEGAQPPRIPYECKSKQHKSTRTLQEGGF